MTIVGQAEISITAGTAQFPAQLAGGVNPALAATDTKMRASATSAKKAWGAAASSIGSAFQEQLGPVQGTLANIGSALKEHGKVAGTLIGGGAGLMGAGIAGATLGSSEQAAMQSLQQSVLNTGHSWTEYSDRAEEAVHKGEEMAFSSKDTLNALSTMTVALHSPEKALGALSFAMNIARKNHVDLATAANLAARAALGQAKGLLPLGVNISADTKLVAASTAARKAQASATATLQDKERAYHQEQRRVAATGKPPTVSEQIALSNARRAVADAQTKVTDTTKAMQAANDAAAGAQHRLDTAVSRAKDNVHGLDSAYVDTFGGHFDVWKTKIEDQTAMLGHQYGPALIGIGVGLQGLGVAYTTGAAVIGRFRGAQDLAKVAAGEATIAIDTETAALSEEGLAGAVSGAETGMGQLAKSVGPVEGAMSRLESSGRSNMGKLGASVIGVAGLIGSYQEGKHNAGGSEVGDTLMGAVTGAVAGFASGFGPAGAIVGAVAGGTAALIGHFHETTHAIDAADQAAKTFGKDLTKALESGGKGSALGVISDYLTKNPTTTKALAKAGITAADVRDYLLGTTTGTVKNQAEVEGWKKVAAFLNTWQSRGLNGQGQTVTTEDNKVADLLRAMLKVIGPALSEAKDYQKVVHPHRGHRAGGGAVAAGASYVVGEHGPEVLQMGATDGHVYSHNGIGPRGSGAELVDQVRAQRIDTLRLINGIDRLIRATEDTPHGLSRELTRGGHHLRSPELASL